ncbi:MAG: DoxX family protein [Bacteroidota bacterium]
MNPKIRKIVGWVLSGLLGALLILSAIGKLSGGEAAEGMVKWGFSESEVILIGVGELLSLIVFLIPRTSSLGTLLLSAYFGGAIATHMQQAPPSDNYTAPAVFLVLVWIITLLRNPGLYSSFRD